MSKKEGQQLKSEQILQKFPYFVEQKKVNGTTLKNPITDFAGFNLKSKKMIKGYKFKKFY